MICIKDRVHPYYNMSQTATVVDIQHKISQDMIQGGPLQQKVFALIKLDKTGQIMEIPMDDLMRIE